MFKRISHNTKAHAVTHGLMVFIGAVPDVSNKVMQTLVIGDDSDVLLKWHLDYEEHCSQGLNYCDARLSKSDFSNHPLTCNADIILIIDKIVSAKIDIKPVVLPW